MGNEFTGINKPKMILLDVYETLLDMSDVEKRVNYLMDSKRGYLLWFELFMEYCFVDNCTAQFNDFTSIAKATMQMCAKSLGNSISATSIDEVLDMLKHLPVHEGIQEGLSQLNDLDLHIAALTNAPERTVTDRMELTGLISYFDNVLSAEHVKKYKPCTEVYTWAAKKLGVQLNETLLISSHGWDVAGAANAGMITAYIKQGRQILYPLAPKPNFTCNSLSDLANQLKEWFEKEAN